jgi:hypothetical protein
MDHDSLTKTIPPQLQRCIHGIVQNVCKQVAQQHLDGFDLKESFRSLLLVRQNKLFSDLMCKNNDP